MGKDSSGHIQDLNVKSEKNGDHSNQSAESITTADIEQSKTAAFELNEKDAHYEEKLDKLLSQMKIHATSTPTKDGRYTLVAFCLEHCLVEDALLTLQQHTYLSREPPHVILSSARSE